MARGPPSAGSRSPTAVGHRSGGAAAGYRLLHPGVDALDLARPDQRADLGLRRRRIADLERAGALGEAAGQFWGDRGMGEHALYGHADLAGVIEAALGKRRDGVVEVGVGRDDHRRRAAVLERAAGAWREPRAQAPADPGAADEAQETDARIGGERARHIVAVQSDRLAPFLRQAGLVQHGHETKAGERRGGRRLDDHRAAGGDRRRDLVNH